MERFPAAREGDLSKMRAAVVDEQGLSEMARALDLGALLRLGRGEELTGGREKASLLADAMEAVVAAVYVGARARRRSSGSSTASSARPSPAPPPAPSTATTRRSCRSSPRAGSGPRRATGSSPSAGPDHSKIFEVETDLRGEVVGRGEGRSKKDAEQAAAKLALEAIGRRLPAEEPRRRRRGGARLPRAERRPPRPRPRPRPSARRRAAPRRAGAGSRRGGAGGGGRAAAHRRGAARAAKRGAPTPTRRKAAPARRPARKGRGTKR